MPNIKAGDVNLEYIKEGSGPPLLMIMGFAGQATSWSQRFVDLLNQHFTTIRVSNRGTGTSETAPDGLTVRMMADDAANVMTELGIEKSHVLGISMGGMIAQEYVLAYPRRVQGLVLGCTAPGGPNTVMASGEVGAMLAPTPGLSREEMVRKAWPALCAPSFIEANQAFMDEMLHVSLTNSTPIDTIMKQVMAIGQFNAYDRLGQIRTPTLVIHGDADVLVPPQNGNTVASQIPGAELMVMPGAAHMFFWEFPTVVADAVVVFLAKVPTPA